MFYEIVYRIVWPIFHLIFPYKVVGREKLPTGENAGFVLCANHISIVDPAYLVYMLRRKRRIYFMAKQELFKTKIGSWFIRACGGFPIDRKHGGTDGIKQAEEILKNKQTLGIFPEGTRSKTGELLKGKPGCAMLVNQFDTFVLPVTIVTKNQRVRPFRKVTLVVGDPIRMPEKAEDVSSREHLRVCTAAIMQPFADTLKAYEK